jgi:hypothetical protein
VASNGLIEKVRTNLVLQSEGFSTASWGKTSVTITANTTAAPDGTTTADTFDGTGAFGFISQSPTLGSGALATYSIYLKNIDAPYVNLQVRTTVTAGLARFDFTGSTLTSTTLTTGISSSFTDVGNGWYRCVLVCTTSEVNQQFRIQVPNSGDSVFVWGAMAEVGDIATDYIPTTTTDVSVGPVSGLPRLDYLNSTCPKLLLEPQRSNLVLQSESFNNAAWTKTNATVTANAATSPDGYVNADKLITNNAALNGQVNQTISKAATATTYTISAFAKKDEWNQAYLYISDSASFANRLQAFFNIETGTLIQANAFGTFTAASGKIENYGNGWYRISATVTTSTETSILARIYSIDSVATVGDGTSGIYIWGAQLEAGAYASSYLNTLSTSVTRVADVVSKNAISSILGGTEGTIFFEWDYQPVSSTTGAWLNFFGVGTSNIGFASSGVNSIRTRINLTTDIISAVNPTNTHKVALAFNPSGVILYANGTQYTLTNGGSQVVFGLTDFSIGTSTGGIERLANLDINQMLYFPTSLTNAQLAELTTL